SHPSSLGRHEGERPQEFPPYPARLNSGSVRGTRRALPRWLGGKFLNSTVKTALLWVVIIVLVFLLWSLFQTTKGTSEPIAFSQFIERVNKGQVEKVTIRGDEIRGSMKAIVPPNQREFHLNGPSNYPAMIDLLNAKNVIVEFEPKETTPFLTALITWAPVLFLIGLWIFFMRQMQAGGNKALSFGKSKAKLLSGSAKKVTFKDVAGVDEAKL